MPHTTSNPLRKIRITRRREESPIRLLPGGQWLRLFIGRDGSVLGGLLSQRLHFSPMVRLPLLAVVDEEGERGGQTDYDEAFQDAVVEGVVVLGGVAGHAVREGGVVVVVFVGGAVVVRVRLFEEIGDPFAERPFFFRLWSVLGGG